MRTFTSIVCVVALGTCVLVSRLEAAGNQDPSAISAAAERAVRAAGAGGSGELLLESGPLDTRLRLADCDRPLSAFLTDPNPLRYQNTVGVRCDGSTRWTIYTTVRVETQAPVLVSRRGLQRDEELDPSEFRLETRRVPGLISAYVTDIAALKGQRLRRPLPSGEPLGFDALVPANLIHRGQSVVLIAHTAGFEVRMSGIALADGRALERIRVQNTSSQRVVEGIVRSGTEVETPL
jgi:flagella basal body P-ring formation protein FlgA